MNSEFRQVFYYWDIGKDYIKAGEALSALIGQKGSHSKQIQKAGQDSAHGSLFFTLF